MSDHSNSYIDISLHGQEYVFATKYANSGVFSGTPRCLQLSLWRKALIQAELPDIVVQTVVVRHPKVGSECNIHVS